MKVIYEQFSIAGWIALGVFLLYWGILSLVRLVRRNRAAERRGFEVIQAPVKGEIQQNVEHHEDQP